MTALTLRQSRSPGTVFVLLTAMLLIALSLTLFTLRNPPQQLPTLHAHALKHAEARAVHTFLSTTDTTFCKYQCGNRVYYACKMPGGKFAFAVVDALYTITAFIADADYALARTRDNPQCKPFINSAHP